MTTSTRNTRKHGPKVFSFAFAVAIALFGAGCSGADEGGEETTEQAGETQQVGETQQAITGTIDPVAVERQKKIAACKAAGGVWVDNFCWGNSGNPIVPSGG